MDPTVWIILVVFIIGFGGLLLFMTWRRRKERKDLREHGQRVIAYVTEIERNRTVNPEYVGYDVYYLVAEWTDSETGQTRTLRSDQSLSKPQYQVGQEVPVLIDPNEHARYVVEI